MTAETAKQREQIIRQLSADRVLAHATLFAHRHNNNTAPFHRRMINLWHSASARVLMLAFRGAAKSTISEEGVILQACFQEFKNGIILGESYDRACERLTAIKSEFANNPYIEDLFGDLVGSVWQEGKIILNNGVIIQAFGRGQSLRGAKHLDQRPDQLFGDDIEGDEDASTPEARKKTREWFWGTVLPSLDPKHRIRVAATPLDPDALPARMQKEGGFIVEKIPIYSINEEGEEVPAWPDRFPMKEVNKIKAEMYRVGLSHKWMQEYMCEAEDAAEKPFTVDQIKIRPQVRTWQPTWAFYDPARTVKKRSATTGVAIWSWINNRLVIWDAYGNLWKPDEIIQDIFRVNAEYQPIAIGVEPDGLEEFILQPLRQAQITRGDVVPFRAIRAPRSKLDFIKGLQPFFKAGEVEFAKDLPDLQTQLLSFPTGKIDVPNALAYALKMRPGIAVYEDFDASMHVVESLAPIRGQRAYVALNATSVCTTAIMFQYVDGVLHILNDWIREGEPSSTLAYMANEIRLDIGNANLKFYAPLSHFQANDIIGLRAAARAAPIELAMGNTLPMGRQELQRLLKGSRKGEEALQIASRSRWTLNAFAGGYCKVLDKQGMLTDEAEDNVYKLLMEGLESVLSFTAYTQEDQGRYAVTADGRRYLTAKVE